MYSYALIFSILGLGLGFATGYFSRNKIITEKQKEIEEKISVSRREAESKAKEALLEAKNEALKMQDEVKREEQERRGQLEKVENRLMEKEEVLDKKIETVDRSREDLELKVQRKKKLREEVEEIYEMQKTQLEKVATLSKEEAKGLLMKKVEEESKEEILAQIEKSEKNLKEEMEEKARNIIAEAVQKYAAETAMESTATIVTLPNDEMKGRIIGREGRNINTFEQITGIDVIVDDTPGSIVISGYDLVRRYIAKVALEKLVADGRIHPARIEEVVQKSKEEVNTMMKELGEKAVYDTGVAGLHPNLVKILGRLKFRVSYGQNVLKHSMEVAYLAASLASELGADVNLCKKGGLLHDIGKAVDHEIQGHHALIGRDILRKFGLSEEVIHIVEAHHNHVKPKSIEALIVQAANAISISRPGAHTDNLDNYIKRLEELENVANSFSGVDKSYAIQAGREVRVFVSSEQVDDLGAIRLARDITKKIENDLQYPGLIKVDVIREKRGVAYAA